MPSAPLSRSSDSSAGSRGDDTVGAVGSAGSTLEMDDTCAKAGIAKVADQLK